jgi:hypothetical protein
MAGRLETISELATYPNPINWNEKVVYHNQEWPKAFQETIYQKIARIVFDILSILIFPIGLIRLTRWVICKLLTPIVIPAAYFPEKIVDNLKDFSPDSLASSLTRHVLLSTLTSPLSSGNDFCMRIEEIGGEWGDLASFFEDLKISLDSLHHG